MLKLKQWMKSNKVTQQRLADQLKISQSYLSDLINGRRTISLQLAHDVEGVTHGAVPMTSWLAAPAKPAGPQENISRNAVKSSPEQKETLHGEG